MWGGGGGGQGGTKGWGSEVEARSDWRGEGLVGEVRRTIRRLDLDLGGGWTVQIGLRATGRGSVARGRWRRPLVLRVIHVPFALAASYWLKLFDFLVYFLISFYVD